MNYTVTVRGEGDHDFHEVVFEEFGVRCFTTADWERNRGQWTFFPWLAVVKVACEA